MRSCIHILYCKLGIWKRKRTCGWLFSITPSIAILHTSTNWCMPNARHNWSFFLLKTIVYSIFSIGVSLKPSKTALVQSSVWITIYWNCWKSVMKMNFQVLSLPFLAHVSCSGLFKSGYVFRFNLQFLSSWNSVTVWKSY